MRSSRLAVLAAVALAGCGTPKNQKPEPQQVRDAFQSYAEALHNRDPDGLCAAMSGRLSQKMARLIASDSRMKQLQGKSCAEVMGLIMSYADQNGRGKVFDLFKSMTLSNIKIHGESAEFDVKLLYQGRSTTFPGGARKEGGRWRISCCATGGR